MTPTNAVAQTRRTLRGTQGCQVPDFTLKHSRIAFEVKAPPTRGAHFTYRLRVAHELPKTAEDSTSPSTRFTPTPAEKAANGRPTSPRRSLRRVVSPIARKPNTNASVRKFLIGVTSAFVAE